MWKCQLLFLLPLWSTFVVPQSSGVTAGKQNLTIGYLVESKITAIGASGALKYAVERVNANETLLPDYNLVIMWNNKSLDHPNSVRTLVEQMQQGAVAFFGPENACYVEASVAKAMDLPLISYKCSDSAVSDKEAFPTFVRTFPPDKQVIKSIIALLVYHRWFKFTILHEDSTRWETVAKELINEAKSKNLTVNENRAFTPPLTCCAEKKPCCEPSGFTFVIEETYKKTRVYVFLGSPNDLVKMMKMMKYKDLLKNGEYIVIYVDLDYNDDNLHRFLMESFEMTKEKNKTYEIVNERSDIGQSLLVISPTAPSADDANYKDFVDKVRQYSEEPPFNFRSIRIFNDKGILTHVPVFANFLYDSVILYAEALHETLSNNHSLRNGTEIVRLIRKKIFLSIAGVSVQIDKHGDAEGNFSVLAYRSDGYSSKGMLPVGLFYLTHKEENSPEFRLLTGKTINWIRGEKPTDEPPCGYFAEKCQPQPDKKREIAAGILGGLLVVVVASAVILYRNWKYEQEIAGLLWKLNIKEIETQSTYKMSAYSNLSVTSQNSNEFRTADQIFIKTTGRYKGTIVAIKKFKFKKKIVDIPRETKIEMKLMKEIRHDNINPFIGSCLEPNQIYIITEYCSKGSLTDILENDNLKLEPMVISSLILDLIKGMTYLHNSDLKCHGNLKSSNCVVTSRWALQVADFGLHEIRRIAQQHENKEDYPIDFAKLWTAPEILRCPASYPKGSQKGDVYSFAIILYEIFGREGPYPHSQFGNMNIKVILERVTNPGDSVNGLFRPDLSILQCQEYIISCINDCWQEKPEVRPDFEHIRHRLKTMRQGMKSNIYDHMMALMENYAENLEEVVNERTRQLVEEKKLTETLLHRMLPQSVAAALMRGEYVTPEAFDAVTIYFSDIVGFTNMSAESTPMEVVTFLNELYTIFDNAISSYEVYKVETIGDAYMVVSGLPLKNDEKHAGEIASMALDLLAAVKTFRIPHKPTETLKLRIGIHTGPVVAGVVGKTMPRYCLFGDTVNTASRMESNGEALKIHISQQCKDALMKLGGYEVQTRGTLSIKGKGQMTTYWLVGHEDEFSGAAKKKDTRELSPLFSVGRIMSVDMGQQETMWKSYRGVGIPRVSHQSTRSIQEFGDKSNRARNYSPVRQLSVYHSYVEGESESTGRINNTATVSEESGGSGDTIPADEQQLPVTFESPSEPQVTRLSQIQPVPSPQLQSNHVNCKLLNNNCVNEHPRSVVIEPTATEMTRVEKQNSSKSNGKIGKLDVDSLNDETTRLLTSNCEDQLGDHVNDATNEDRINEEEKSEVRKRWRSCSEINVPTPRSRPKTFKNWITGLFNYRESLGSIPRAPVVNDGESVV